MKLRTVAHRQRFSHTMPDGSATPSDTRLGKQPDDDLDPRGLEERVEDTGNIRIRILGSHERAVLDRVAPEVFDHGIDPRWSAEFLADARHHLAVALEAEQVIGMASAVHYLHPDKAPELWINEVGVAPSHRGRGIGKQLLGALLAHGRELGCREAWVLTEEENAAARRLYASVGGEEEADSPVMFTFGLTEVEGS